MNPVNLSANSAAITERHEGDEKSVIPVYEEQLRVQKQVVEHGGVRVIKSVVSEEAVVEEPTLHESVTVERVAVNRLLEQGEPLPESRREGDRLIIPIFEEVVVTEKRVRVTEELHILTARAETVTPQSITIRREQVRVEPIASE